MALETILLIAFCISILSAAICRAGEIFSFQSISFCTIRSSNKAYSRFRRSEKSIFSFLRPTLDDFMRETVSISCTMLSIVLMIQGSAIDISANMIIAHIQNHPSVLPLDNRNRRF